MDPDEIEGLSDEDADMEEGHLMIDDEHMGDQPGQGDLTLIIL